MLKNTKLQLAGIKESYKDQYYEIYLENKNYHTYAYSEPKPRDKFDQRFEDSDTDPCFVLVGDKNEVMAFCGVEISRLDGWAEVNFMVKAKYQGQGYGKKILNLVIDQLKQLSNIDYLEALTFDNIASESLLLSVGFVKTSFYPNYRKIIKDGQYVTLNENGYYLKIK